MPLCEYTNIFTDVIQIKLGLIEYKEMVGKCIAITRELNDD